MSDKEDNVYMAKLAEQAERYDEMAMFMKRVALLDVELGVEERNLLSVAYKNVVGGRRQSWRIVSSVEQKKASQGEAGNEEILALFAEYRKKIEGELTSTCNELIDLINNHLYQKNPSSNFDSQVFYVKMLGDYYRYMAEYSPSPEKENYSAQSLKAYKEASDLAREKLASTNPIRLGLALNFSVFYYEIGDKQQLACKLAKAAFDEAMGELDSVSEEDYKDSTLIMQLLRDNLTLWTKDLPDENNIELEDVEQDAD